MSPLNVRHPVIQAPPQTLDAAYKRFVGDVFDEPDWEAYEKAVDAIIRDKVPVNGHSPDCPVAHFPSALSDIFHATEDGAIVAKCRHCMYVIARHTPDQTEVVPR